MNRYEKIWRDIFDVAAASGKEEYQKVLYGSANEALLQRALVEELLTKMKRSSVPLIADIGCGTGGYFGMLAKMGFRAFGCDYSWGMLRSAKEKEGARLCQAAAESLPYGEGLFDAVISIGVLQTVKDYKVGISELCRILKPGGMLVISTLRSPVIWELPIMPIAELFIYDHSVISGQWYHKLIGDRTGLSWHNRPQTCRAKRFGASEVRCILRGQGIVNIRHCYLGRLRHIPMLLNSQIVTFSGIKT